MFIFLNLWDDRKKLAEYGINCISYSPKDDQHSDLTHPYITNEKSL